MSSHKSNLSKQKPGWLNELDNRVI